MPRVMLLIPSTSYRASDFLEAAGRLGVEVVVGSDERHPLEDLLPGRQVGLNFIDVEAGTGQIEAFAERFPLDTILAVDDGGTRLAAAASRRLELPHNPVAAVEATRNKALLRQRLAAGLAILGAVLNVLFNLVLIRCYGTYGAVVATLASYALCYCCCFLLPSTRKIAILRLTAPFTCLRTLHRNTPG